jgi:plastocyanin
MIGRYLPIPKPSYRAAMTLILAFLIAETLVAVALAGEIHRISQKNRAFSLNSITIAKGDVMEFSNDDEFIHQIYVKSDDFNVDTDESAPGNTISVPFTVSGTFQVHCHIHPKMQLIVTVK